MTRLHLLLVMLAGAIVLALASCGKEGPPPAASRPTTDRWRMTESPQTPAKGQAESQSQPVSRPASRPTAPPIATTTAVAMTPEAIGGPPDIAGYEAFLKDIRLPACRVSVVDKAPVVDGDMDDAYKAATALDFKLLEGGQKAPAPTTVRCLSTTRELFFFFEGRFEDPATLRMDHKKGDISIWTDDCFEIFIDTDNRRDFDSYVHFFISPAGVTVAVKGPGAQEDGSYNPKFAVKTKVGKKSWTAEVAIPFAELVKAPARMNRVWAVNFVRHAHLLEGEEYSAWSPTLEKTAHQPKRFGYLWLDAGSVDNTRGGR